MVWVTHRSQSGDPYPYRHPWSHGYNGYRYSQWVFVGTVGGLPKVVKPWVTIVNFI
jgi:hypothetical protein